MAVVGEISYSENNGNDVDIDMVILISNDGDEYKVSPKVAMLSKVVEETIQCNDNIDRVNTSDGLNVQEVHLPNVRSVCLARVVEFCTYHVNVEPMEPIPTPLHGNTLEDNISQVWFREFVTSLDTSMVFELVTAANYMDIKPLLDLACLVVTVNLFGKTAEQIRVTLNIPEMTAEEKGRAMAEHRWIFGE